MPTVPVSLPKQAQPKDQMVDRDTLLAEIRAMYATALEYPEEVFTDDVLLEAELGVDSVKQIELMARVSAKYDISEQAQGLRLSDYDTLGKVVDFVHAALVGRRIVGSADDRPIVGSADQRPIVGSAEGRRRDHPIVATK